MTTLARTASLPPTEETMRRQIACATLRLRRYRLARDRAQMKRLENAPGLKRAIAALLDARS
ncbi:hypothetical protein [Aestuariivirga sp.]|uniref:hypothetical protein n=1 Tax=Aestuariivirga sp. TaxID=2650926 RepID=UPI003593D3D9